MNGRKRRRWLAWGLALALAAVHIPAAAAMTLGTSRPDPGRGGGGQVYEISLDTVIVAAGENWSYLTVSPVFSGSPFAQDYYPGELTVELTGPITVAAGGTLNIGKLAVGGTEPSPILRGELPPEGLIRVEAGGVLWLNGVTLELSGDGPVIVQEPGALVEIYNVPLEGLCQWGGAVADNRYAAPVELALAQGETLEENHLPKDGGVWRNEGGRSEYRRLSMEWDISPCRGQTEGEATVSGRYLDEDGEPLPAIVPVEAEVRWYTPEDIILTDKSWMGNTAASARLGYLPLPEEAVEIWGELSRDGGKTWERWEKCDFDEADGHLTCTFSLSDATPRQYRLMATDWTESRFWRSEAVTLPEEAGEDQGGNRGGSTDPAPPSREPEPEDDRGSQNAEPEPVPVPSPAPTEIPVPVPAETPGLEGETFPWPEEIPSFEPEPTWVPVPEVTVPAAMAPPEPEPLSSAAPADPTPSAAPADPVREPEVPADPEPEPTRVPQSVPSLTPTPDKGPEAFPPAEERRPLETVPPTAAHPSSARLSPTLQLLLAAAGLAVCAGVGVAIARGGLFRRRR